MLMHSRKEPAAERNIQTRVRVPPRDVHSALNQSILIPLNGDSVRRVFRRQPEYSWPALGPKLAQPNQANACNCEIMNQLGPEWWRQEPLHAVGINAIVDENTTFNDSFHDRQSHGTFLDVACLEIHPPGC